jgi:hypothetical protein
MYKWISVKDSLPEKDGYYLCFNPKWKKSISVLKFGEWTKNSRKRFWSQSGEEAIVIYWMSLPELPNE